MASNELGKDANSATSRWWVKKGNTRRYSDAGEAVHPICLSM